MSPDGDIYSPEQIAALKARDREQLVPIPDAELARVKAMPREQRKVWYRKNRGDIRAEFARTASRDDRLADQAERLAARRPERVVLDADERRRARNRRKAA